MTTDNIVNTGGTSPKEEVNPIDLLGLQLLMAMARLCQLIRIHLPNNKLVVDSIREFRQALHEICLISDGANIRMYRGRLYFNHDKLKFNPSLSVAMDKLMEFLQAREIQGLRMYEKDDLTDEDVIQVVALLNRADKEKDPVAWMQVELDKANQTWVELQADQENKTPKIEDSVAISLAAISGGTKKTGKVEKTEADQNQNGQEEQKPDSKQSMADLAQRTYAQVMASMARKTYSHALTSILSMSVKGGMRKKVGIQKSKRVVQGMIEILTKDESALLGMSTIRNYDDYTYTHSVNVAILAMCIGRRLGLSQHLVEQLGLSGLFHDLGKVDVPIELISKTSKLTEEEYERVKAHSINSVRQIIRLNADHTLKAKLVLPPFEHHLGVDLSGYPQTDRKVPVSLLGRILAVADHYDAMTSSRSYRKIPISPDIALKIMIEEAGTVLDPVIIKIFIEMMGVYPVGSLLVLDTKEVGLAARTMASADSGRPIVLLLARGPDKNIKKAKYVNLADRHPETGKFLRNIKDCYHPAVFGIQPADFLV